MDCLVHIWIDFSLSWIDLDFLSTDVMHGEGNLLAHLTIVGYKVTYQQVSSLKFAFTYLSVYEIYLIWKQLNIGTAQNLIRTMCIVMQSSLVEYNFRVMELFEDLRDGVRLCRAIQLLQHDSSILLVRFK